MYNSYEITFDGAGLWGFGSKFAKNVVTFRVHISSSSHTDNHKNILGKWLTHYINGSVSTAGEKFYINSTTVKSKFSLSFHHIGINGYLFAHEKNL